AGGNIAGRFGLISSRWRQSWHPRGLGRIVASAERSCRSTPIGRESFAEIFFRNVEGLGRRGSGGGLHSTYELFVLVGIRQLRVWAQEAVNQFALLLLGIARRRQSKKGEAEQAEPHRFRLRNPARFVKKKTHGAPSQRDQPDQHQ